MKSLIRYTIIITLLAFVGACKKDSTTPSNPTTPTATACNGMTLCFKMDGTDVSKNATWKVISGTAPRNRIYWEDNSTGSNIEIDVYGSTTGTYAIKANPASGEAGFQYYLKDAYGTKNIQGQSGTLEVTSVANDKMTGTFTVTASDGSKTYQITDGNFVNVPK